MIRGKKGFERKVLGHTNGKKTPDVQLKGRLGKTAWEPHDRITEFVGLFISF